MDNYDSKLKLIKVTIIAVLDSVEDFTPTATDHCNNLSDKESLISDEDKTPLPPFLSVSVNYILRRDITC